MTIKACIFDLDGVIVDTAKYHFLAWKRLADMLHIEFTSEDNERLKGVSRMESLDIILEIGGVNPGEARKQEYAELKNSWYNEYIETMTPAEILPGCVEFITDLKGDGISTAIGSASKNTPLILERVGLGKTFDAVADGNVVQKAKPDPEIFLTAASMLGVVPSDCAVFEDAAAGIEAGLAAGMLCIGVGSEYILKKAHYIVPGINRMSLAKLREIEKIYE
jgi:beta-phosphoglucomutase